MKTSDQRGRAFLRDYSCRHSHCNSPVRNIFSHNGINTDNTVVSHLNAADNLCAIAECYAVAYFRIFKTETFAINISLMVKAEENTHGDIAIATNLSRRVNYYRSIMADAKAGANLGLPGNLKAIFYRIMPECNATYKIQWII